jgi:hypothetical protein
MSSTFPSLLYPTPPFSLPPTLLRVASPAPRRGGSRGDGRPPLRRRGSRRSSSGGLLPPLLQARAGAGSRPRAPPPPCPPLFSLPLCYGGDGDVQAVAKSWRRSRAVGV